ncbi:MAG: enoyl-CoA hydratase-related protein [Bacteroidota bacterium]
MKKLQTITYETVEEIGWISLNRPEVRNAFNDEMIDELNAAFEEIHNSKAKALVIRGKGPVFSAGADLNWMKKVVGYTYEENRMDSKKLQELFENMYMLPVPTISMIHGACIGGANGLAAASDIVMAENETRFQFSEVRIGLIPATVAPYVIKRTGEHAAKYYMLTGKSFYVKDALRIGLIDTSGNQESLDTELEIILKEVGKNSVQAVKQTKKLINDIGRTNRFNEIREMSIDAIAKARISEDGQEGMKAFLEKRKPRWLNI